MVEKSSAVYELTHKEAQLRSSIVSEVKYDLRLSLSTKDSYAGFLNVSFEASDPCECLWVDFKGSEVSEVKINSAVVPVNHTNSRIALPRVQKGVNQVEIRFHNKYSRDGLGLHYYKDPEDQEVYLYTQFEPFSANRMFPCFDQPDLKATLDLVIKAPTTWKIITSEYAISSTSDYSREMPVVHDYQSTEPEIIHVFPGKYRISTYLYSLCAGPYVEHRYDDNELGIPFGLYCRKTMDKHLVPKMYFHWTVEGHKFYKNFFDVPYPFSKYDQVFVPEFNMGAMENVGCVTYRDQYIFKDPPSDVQLHRVCNTFLHEMAHMWFGNLVTMKWWDDLWLNESFATFMSSLAIDTQLRDTFPLAWREFLGSKGWGYATDQMSTTHPISTQVKTTTETETNFDGISYSKGSAVLKQLYFLVGGKVFQTASARYMKRFKFANAEFADLIKFIGAAAYEAGCCIDVQAWANSWILTAGLNELTPVLTHAEGKLTNFIIQQRPAVAAHCTLRNHSIIVEAFDSNLNSLGRVKVLVKAQEETEITDFIGTNAAVVLLNVEDWGYCKVRIDENSLTSLKKDLVKIQDPLTRQIVYRALWDMVRDSKLSAVEFVQFVTQQLPHESDCGLANYSLEISNAALYNYVPTCPTKENLAHNLFAAVLEKVKNSTPENSLTFQKILKAFIYHPEDVKLALSWVEADDTKIPGFVLGKLDRWSIIKKFATISEEAKSFVEAEYIRDPSDTGHFSKLYCEAAYPNSEAKAKLWENILTSEESKSRYERESIMSGFNVERQRDVLESLSEKFYEQVLPMITTRDKEFYIDFCHHLIPAYMPDSWNIERLENIIEKLPADKFEVARGFKETLDALKRIKNGKDCSQAYIDSLAN